MFPSEKTEALMTDLVWSQWVDDIVLNLSGSAFMTRRNSNSAALLKCMVSPLKVSLDIDKQGGIATVPPY